MDFNNLYSEYEEKINSLGLNASEHLLLASIDRQHIHHLQMGKLVKGYKMSSSKRPPSCIENSLGTPWGLHNICEKIGEGCEIGTVFEGRVSIGLKAEECTEEIQSRNLITSRILRLEGLEQGVNRGGEVDTFRRYVYIHGTNHEQQIGIPASSGCLQMENQSVIELFDLVNVGTHLYIQSDFNSK